MREHPLKYNREAQEGLYTIKINPSDINPPGIHSFVMLQTKQCRRGGNVTLWAAVSRCGLFRDPATSHMMACLNALQGNIFQQEQKPGHPEQSCCIVTLFSVLLYTTGFCFFHFAILQPHGEGKENLLQAAHLFPGQDQHCMWWKPVGRPD